MHGKAGKDYKEEKKNTYAARRTEGRARKKKKKVKPEKGERERERERERLREGEGGRRGETLRYLSATIDGLRELIVLRSVLGVSER